MLNLVNGQIMSGKFHSVSHTAERDSILTVKVLIGLTLQ